jgi:hypothetical protein
MEERGGQWELYALMSDENPPDKTGNEPAPLLLAAVAIVPLLAVVAGSCSVRTRCLRENDDVYRAHRDTRGPGANHYR